MALEDFKFYKIRLDRTDMTMAAPLTAKEGAVNGNGIELQVINGSTIEDMSNFAVYLNWKHQTTGAQGSEPFTLVDVNNAVYRLHYPTEMLVGGVVRADIKVVDAESVTVSTAELSIRVAQAATDTTVQSENAWNDIQAILVQNQANSTRMSEIEADLANVPSFDEIASKPTNEATATANTVLASNGDGTGTFKDAGAIISGATTKTTPVDADTVALSDSAASGALKKLSWANIKATLKAYLDTIYAAITHGHNQSDIANLTTDLAGKAPTAHIHDDRYYTEAEVNGLVASKAPQSTTYTKTEVDGLVADKQDTLVSGTNIKTVNGNSLLGVGNLSTDWNLISATLTYASADSPTFVANTSIDLTSVIGVGMKIKLTQTTVKYFIVTAITSTTITLYGGTDYVLANATITLPYFSSMKSPFGFPLSEAKWTVSQEYTSFTLLPVNKTWLNIGNYNVNVPIGNWKVRYSVGLRSHVTAINGNYSNVYFGLSTSPTSQTNNDLMVGFGDDYGNSANEIYIRQINLTKNGNFIASSKTTLYLIFKVNDYVVLIEASNGITNDYSPIKVELVCAYL